MGNVIATFVVHLACGHVGHFSHSQPAVGNLVFCMLCDDYSRVTVKNGAWKVSCVMPDYCRGFSRTFGTDVPRAVSYARNHAQLRDHRTKIWNEALEREFFVTATEIQGCTNGLDVGDSR